MKEIAIIGAGGFGREVAWLINDINQVKPQWNLVGFVDDDPELNGQTIAGLPVLGNLAWLAKQQLAVVCAIGNPLVKRKVLQQLADSQNTYPILIHPSVLMSDDVRIGEGTIICAGNILTVNIDLGKHVILNLSCTIGHDAVIKDYCSLMPGIRLSGNTVLEEAVHIGTGSSIIQGITIGRNAVIGMGSVVIKDIPNNSTAVGVPARVIKVSKE
jgi:sugar O-acyltransferase (sialic acid O-acetyltransferase NeuD family)